MSLIKWTPAMSVGVDSIDDQHKKIFELINKFYKDLNKNPDKENLIDLLKALTDYTTRHLSVEEELMQKYSFQGFITHKAEHDRFIKTISSYKEMLIADKLFISIEVINYLKDWIIEHISVSDKNYCSYLISKGVINPD